MHFDRVRPSPELSAHVEWFWGMRSDSPKPERQKIVPDGLPETIFHFGDPYKIHLHGRWRRQARSLFGGQMKRYFFLENTGKADMFGITWRPAAPTHIFGLNMKDYADRVVPLSQVAGPLNSLAERLIPHSDFDKRVEVAEQFLKPHLPGNGVLPIDRCLHVLFRDHGTSPVEQVCRETGLNERQMQRLFQRYIGLSPKFYSRILRFSHLFTLIKEGKSTWSDVVYLSGYYDQPHFIRDFKAFTGEDPTRFSYRDETLTDFFTRKKGGTLSGLSKP